MIDRRKGHGVLVGAATPLLFAVAAPVDAREPGREQEQAQTLSAQDITDAVEDELANDALASLEQVQVSTTNGVVTLTGQVRSLLAKERATHVTETVRGVLVIDNQLAVKPLRPKNPEDLERVILQSLASDPTTEAFEVGVQADAAGQVTLTGSVDSWAERELIERIAKSVAGVTEVTSNIGIDAPSARPDSVLAAEVDRVLQWDAYVNDAAIDVQAKNGVVTLSGTVGSAAEKSRAKRIAWMAGSRSVDAAPLTVVSREDDGSAGNRDNTQVASDQQIAEAVRNALRRSPRESSRDLEVEVDENVVTLRGSVENLKAKRMAVQQARAVSGVESVRERLRVSASDAGPSEQEIRDRVLNALANNVVVEPYTISVEADGRGRVELNGHVDTWFERGVADDVAARVKGVREVDNDLIVLDTDDRFTFDPYVDAWSIYDYDWYNPPPGVQRQDAVIASEVRDELRWSPFVDEGDVNVSVERGVATLTGRVDSFAESRAATENAFEGGAAAVVNELDVRVSE